MSTIFDGIGDEIIFWLGRHAFHGSFGAYFGVGDVVYNICYGVSFEDLSSEQESEILSAFEAYGLSFSPLASVTSFQCVCMSMAYVVVKSPDFVDHVWISEDGTRLLRFGDHLAEIYAVPEGITSISKYAFTGLSYLREVVLPSSIVSIDELAFFESGISSINFPEGLRSIGDYAFYGTWLREHEMDFPDSLEHIGESVFEHR